MSYHTHTFTPEMIKALSVTGQIVTVQRDGETYQGRISIVEARDWTTVHTDSGECVLDLDCTALSGRDEPYVAYDWTTPWGQVTTQWAYLSQVKRGVNLAKRDK